MVNGRDQTASRDRSFVYDVTSDTYEETENADLLRTRNRVGCIVDPRDENIVVCAGGWHGDGIDE